MVRVFARHYFSGPDAVERFPMIIRNLEHLAARTGWPVEMLASFLPTVHPPPVSVRNVTLTLAVSDAAEGAGSKIWDGFFMRGDGVALLVDGDMQTFSAEEISVLKHLIARMRQEGKAFGCAARTVVQMHRETALNNLRIAQEAFYLSFARPGLPDNPADASLVRLPAAYRALGDTFSGCIAIDLDHPAAQQIKAEVEHMRSRGMFRGFALEYYLGMRFAQLGQAVSTYLPTRQEHGVTDRSPAAVREMVRKDWAELRQSLIGEGLAAHIADQSVQEKVAQLVGKSAVSEVLGLLTDG